MQATIIFQENWEAILEVNQDGSRKYRYLRNQGSSRSSKTFSIIQCFYLYAIQNPNKKLSVFRDTKQICKQTVFEDMKKAFISMPMYDRVVLNITESIFKFPNGSSIHIEGTDDPVKIHGYHCDVLWFNEPYNIQIDTFNQLDMRCKDFVIIDLNPRQNHWSEDLGKADNCKTIYSTFRMNPFCPPEQRIKILSYQTISRCEIVVSGIIAKEDARTYDVIENKLFFTERQIKELSRCRENDRKNTADEFNWDVYGLGIKGERPNRIFRWTEIPDHEYHELIATRYIGIDWGTSDPWGILEIKYYDGGLYLHELNYDSENKWREKLTLTERAQIDGSDEGLVTWLFNKFNISTETVIVCDNNRPLKIKALRRAGYDYSIAATKGDGSKRDGISLLLGMKVYFTASSHNLRYEQENYSRKVDNYGVVQEEPEDGNDHICGDPVRYVAEFLRSQGIIKTI